HVSKSFVRGTFLAISPNISEDNIVYVATNAGTLYKSVDQGETFSILTELKKRITSLIISPNFASDKTLYTTTFEGIYKSEDQGISLATHHSRRIFSRFSMVGSSNFS
ncbi:hypothetical protein, partial [Cyanothece sp. BG0011]|uniref:WD40/YVTN/BNR-like repeat-containing protein n=1 Tax=Cyanothece sp. BG0011 TaxID=2082950 RepID=UPI001E634A84